MKKKKRIRHINYFAREERIQCLFVLVLHIPVIEIDSLTNRIPSIIINERIFDNKNQLIVTWIFV